MPIKKPSQAILLLFLVTAAPLAGHGDLHEVIGELSMKIEASPMDTGLLLERAEYLRKHRDMPRALQDVALVKKLQPGLTTRHLVLAAILSDQKKWKRAKLELDKFLVVYPDDVTALVLRSRCCGHLGLTEQAEDGIRRAIKLHPRAPLSFYRQYVDFLLKRNDIEAALKVYAGAEKSLGPLPVLGESKARMLRDRGRPDDASAVYSMLRQQNPTLSFGWWMEEAQMWETRDHVKMKHAMVGAKQAWQHLPARTRALPHMKLKYQKLLENYKIHEN
jgi:tetratricopeptide (TPR) repeat protein